MLAGLLHGIRSFCNAPITPIAGRSTRKDKSRGTPDFLPHDTHRWALDLLQRGRPERRTDASPAARISLFNRRTLVVVRDSQKWASFRGVGTNRSKFMNESDKKFLAIMPKLKSRQVEVLLEDVIGCRWSISVLHAVGRGVNRPGALERRIVGISTKVLNDRLRTFTRAGEGFMIGMEANPAVAFEDSIHDGVLPELVSTTRNNGRDC
jgi:HxlR-like helix-turn-helix